MLFFAIGGPYISKAIKTKMAAATQKRQPKLVVHPSQRKSNTIPKPFSTQPARPKTTKRTMMRNMIPMIAITRYLLFFDIVEDA